MFLFIKFEVKILRQKSEFNFNLTNATTIHGFYFICRLLFLIRSGKSLRWNQAISISFQEKYKTKVSHFNIKALNPPILKSHTSRWKQSSVFSPVSLLGHIFQKQCFIYISLYNINFFSITLFYYERVQHAR